MLEFLCYVPVGFGTVVYRIAGFFAFLECDYECFASLEFVNENMISNANYRNAILKKCSG